MYIWLLIIDQKQSCVISNICSLMMDLFKFHCIYELITDYTSVSLQNKSGGNNENNIKE